MNRMYALALADVVCIVSATVGTPESATFDHVTPSEPPEPRIEHLPFSATTTSAAIFFRQRKWQLRSRI